MPETSEENEKQSLKIIENQLDEVFLTKILNKNYFEIILNFNL